MTIAERAAQRHKELARHAGLMALVDQATEWLEEGGVTILGRWGISAESATLRAQVTWGVGTEFYRVPFTVWVWSPPSKAVAEEDELATLSLHQRALLETLAEAAGHPIELTYEGDGLYQFMVTIAEGDEYVAAAVVMVNAHDC